MLYVFKICLQTYGDDDAQKSQNYKQQFKEQKIDGMCIKNSVYMYANNSNKLHTKICIW